MIMKTAIYSIGIVTLFFLSLLYTELAFGKNIDRPRRHSSMYMSDSGSFVFNPRSHHWYAISSNGRVIKQGRASGGRGYCPDIHRSCRTPTGVYHVLQKGGAGCRSTRYPVGRGGSPMPYCMFFSKYYAVHGSYEVPGYNASHGCIRVPPSDAHWLTNNFMHVGTRIVIKPY